jgi:uncharacterized protein
MCHESGQTGQRRGCRRTANMSALVLPMGIGSILGAFLGGILVPYVPAGALKLALGAILIISAVRIFLSPKRSH